jgi:cytochrome b involved in lipid metabolism
VKRIVTVCIFVFWTIYVGIIAGGLAQHALSSGNDGSGNTSATVDIASLGTITLDAAEVAKHNTKSSCWMIIESKVYDISGYFGNHPGGDIIMVNFCGKEATTAFKLSPHRHSAYAASLLASYLLGNLGETINSTSKPVTTTPVATTPSSSNTNNSVAPSGGATYTAADVSAHNTSGNCWIIVSNSVYNISSYLGSHPAGAAIITPFCGKESTNAFKYSPHVHSGSATNLLAKYYIGQIGTTTTGTGAITTPPAGTTNTTTSNRNNDDDDD